MVDFDSLPDLARENVFKYLIIGDIRACRLVCKAWYQYFDHPLIRDKEHFVFEEPMMGSVDEINEVLLGYEGSGVNVNLIDVPLGELNFQAFGDKIRGLRICVRDSIFSGHDPRTLVDVLTHTLNIRYFHYQKLKNCWKKYDTKRCIEQDTFPEIIIELHRRNLRFNNLWYFDTTPAFLYPSEFFEIFPRLRSLRSRCMHLRYLHFMVKSDDLLTMEDLAEIGKINVSTGIREIERDFLPSLPRLKKLDVSFQFGYDGREHMQRALNTFLNFFAHQTELETLRISFKCHYICDKNSSEAVREVCTDGGYHYDAAKQLSFHILRSCANLKVLHLKLRGERMRFSNADLQEFVRLTRLSKIRDLTFPLDVLQRAAFRSHFALLHLESLKLHQFLYVHSLRGRITTEAYEALSTFLHSNKNLRRMKIQSTALRLPEGVVLANLGVASIIHGPEKLLMNIHHDRLEHLAIDFHYEEPIEGILFVEYLMSLELPRLSSLKLGKKREWRLPVHSPADAGTDERFGEWIQKMRRLKTVYLHLWWLSFEEVRKICKPLTELQVLAFSNSEDGDCEPKLRDVFNDVPALTKIWYHGSRYTPALT